MGGETLERHKRPRIAEKGSWWLLGNSRQEKERNQPISEVVKKEPGVRARPRGEESPSRLLTPTEGGYFLTEKWQEREKGHLRPICF